ncbi:MAG: hypothetical protein QOG34_267 [Frankiaceae bacterium]|nr:hypothetical protein [Frankiaceae bacterium]
MSEEYVPIRQEHLDALCPELSLVVADAIAAGNRVSETWDSFGHGVLLRHPRPVLVNIPSQTRSALTYRAIDDPHYWLGEIWCSLHPGWFVALPFTAGARDLPSLRLPDFRWGPPTSRRRLLRAVLRLGRR